MLRLAKSVLHDPYQHRFLWALFLINACGSFSGYFWYSNQLVSTEHSLWLFIPDSPLASSMMALAMLILLTGKRPSAVLLAAYTAVIKYGLWAVILITDYWLKGGAFKGIDLMLWTSHLGMALEGVLFLRKETVTSAAVASISIWMLLNDYMDYARDLHPYLFYAGQWLLAMASAVGMTLIEALYLWRKCYHRLRVSSSFR
ncbi:MAG: DUF1405 domain-containing protein [Bacillota bacterium]